jgi:hypothetical protein
LFIVSLTHTLPYGCKLKVLLLAVCGLLIGSCICDSDAAEIKRTVGSQYEPDIISLKGHIAFSDYSKFVEVALDSVNAVVALDSLGGELGTGFDIALYVKQRGFVTYVEADAKCWSSCANIWLAGRQGFWRRVENWVFILLGAPRRESPPQAHLLVML